MTAATIIASKEITTVSGMKLYKLSSLADTNTLVVPFGKVWAVFIQPSVATTPVYASYTVSGSTITFEMSGTATEADVMVWGE